MRIYNLQTYWIGIFIFAIWILVLIKIFLINSYKHNRRKKYMLSRGYEYKVDRVSGYYDDEWYGYRKNGVNVDEDVIDRLTYRELKNRYK